MTISDLNSILQEMGLPFAYYQFNDDTPQQLPFICWVITGHDDLFADDVNYVPIQRVVIELYTNAKDFALEEQVRGVLTQHGIAFAQDGEEIDSEKMHLETFVTEIIISAGADNTEG